jgi:hypothetical protein
MSEEKSRKVMQFFSTVREEYENRIGWTLNTDSRLRVQVEARVALANAIRPYGTLNNVAYVIGKKDHTTIVHSIKAHESHFRWSPNYRQKYKIALECVRDIAKENGVDPYFNQYTLDSMRDEIETIKSVLDMNIEVINKFYNKAEQEKSHWMRELENEILSLPSEVV